MKRFFILGAMLLLLVPFMSMALVVGINDDVHFDYPGQANDFHIEGTIYSGSGIPPKVTDIHIFGDPGTGNWVVDSYCLMPMGPNQWKFTAHFKTDGFITFCQWIHFGIMFDVDAFNVIADLKGWWTFDGAPLTSQQMLQEIETYKQVAITGFDIYHNGYEKMVKITNSTNMPIQVDQLELAVTTYQVPLEDMFSTGLGRPGEQSPMHPGLIWKEAPMVPRLLQPDEFFEFPLSQIGITLVPGQFLQLRGEQYMEGTKGFIQAQRKRLKEANIQNGFDWGWFWEQHGE